MDVARWERVQAIFHAALAADDADRATTIAAACGDDARLLHDVLQLIASDGQHSPLDAGLTAMAAGILDGTAETLPRKVGPYTLSGLVGEGGSGVVYRAVREDIGTVVAIKILRDAWVSPVRRLRFASEQRTLARLEHPGIARIHDADTLADGTPWFAMEFVDGRPLTEHCRALPADADRIRLFLRVCEAVAHAHQHLVVHRDLKPGNILVTTDGSPKLLDFGIARQLEPDGEVVRTRSVLQMLTPAYAAPEQLRGEPAGVQADVYALGVILYELVTGARPFEGDASAAPMGPGALPEIRRPSAHPAPPGGRRLSADIDVLCLTAMHPDCAQRYRSVEALIRDVRHYLDGRPLDAHAPSAAYRLRRFAARHRRQLAAAAMLLTAFGLAGAAALSQVQDARREALAEAARTRRIQRFMLSLFEGGANAGAPDDELKVLALLDRGTQEAAALESDPATQVELHQTLGGIYRELGGLERAEGELARALDTARSTLGPRHVQTLSATTALAELRIAQARLDEALALAKEVVDTPGAALAEDHPVRRAAEVTLGRVLRERGDYAGAADRLRGAVQRLEIAPDAEFELTRALTALAETEFYAGRLDAAEAINQRVLAIDRRLYGPHHPNVAHTLLNLAEIDSSRGRLEEAAARDREALAIFDGWFGRDHPESASARTILAQVLVRQSRTADAIPLLQDALAVQQRVFGPTHPRTAFVLNALGLAAFLDTRYDEAERAFRAAAEAYQSADATRYQAGVALVNLGSVHLARHEDGRAEAVIGEALAIYAQVLPPEHQNIAVARGKLGRALARQRRYRQAEAHLQAAYAVLRTEGPPTSWLQAAREDLAAVYEALGDEAQAARYRAERGLATP